MSVIHNAGLDNTFYWACYVLGFLTMFVFNGFWGKHYGLKAGKSVPFTVVSYILIYAWAYILAWVMNGFEWGHHNAIRVYIWFPLVLWLTSKMFRIDWKTAVEFMVPSTCIVYAIARLGCNFPGCCHGYPARWGIWSWEAGCRCFPVQLCESITAAMIALVTMNMAKKRRYKPDGTLYPVMLILYGGSRFIWEFFANNEKLFFNISELALWALFTFLIGISWYGTVASRKAKRKAS